MTLQDRFYFRWFLYHNRYGRLWAGMLAFVAYCLFIAFCLAVMWGAVRLSVWWFDMQTEAIVQREVKQVQADKVKYERVLITCLQGGIIYLDGKARPCSI